MEEHGSEVGRKIASHFSFFYLLVVVGEAL